MRKDIVINRGYCSTAIFKMARPEGRNQADEKWIKEISQSLFQGHDQNVQVHWIRSLVVRACNLISTAELRQQSFLPDDIKAIRLLELDRKSVV